MKTQAQALGALGFQFTGIIPKPNLIIQADVSSSSLHGGPRSCPVQTGVSGLWLES